MKKALKSFALLVAVVFTGLVFTACVPSNLEKAEAKMKEAGYAVVAMGKDDVEDTEGLVGGLIATKILDGEIITAMLFDSSSSAKDFYEKHVEDKSEKEEVVRKGKWVYVGTENAIKAFEG